MWFENRKQGQTSKLQDSHLDMLLFILTGLGPKVNIKDLMVKCKADLTFGSSVCLAGFGAQLK